MRVLSTRWWRPAAKAMEHIFKAIVTCPDCGFESSLREHTIDAGGVVHPSLVCPGEGCAFHEFVRLEDWNKRELRR